MSTTCSSSFSVSVCNFNHSAIMQSCRFFISLCFFLFAFSSSSIASESIPTVSADELYSTLSFFTSYYTGEEALIGKLPENTTHYYFVRKYARLQIQDHCKTNATGVYRVRGYLLIQFPYWYGGDPPRTDHNYAASRVASRAQGRIRFWLEGLWSEKTRQLLMVGSASWVVEGNPIILDAVLDLNYTAKNNPILFNGYISGSLKSTVCANNPGYFDPLSIFSFPVLASYNYSVLSKVYQGGTLSGGSDVAGNPWPSYDGCWVIMRESIVLEVEYGAECREENEHCSPLGAGDGSVGSLARLLFFTPIQCSAPERKMRYIATFQNTKYDQGFGLNSTVIGEASWDDDKKELFGIACRFLDPLNRSADEEADCTMRLSLRYTSIFTIRNEPKLVGWYRSIRHIDNSSYFGYINLTKSDGVSLITLPDVRYEYTKLDEVRSSCAVKRGRNTYPDVHSDNMRVDLSVENSRGQQIAWVYASPLWVGNDVYKKKNTMISGGEPHHTNTSHSNISYMISLSSSSELQFGSLFTSLNWSANANYEVEMIAEGVYDAETGCLCMVGCRDGDCEILVTLEFYPLTGERGGHAKGNIMSTRATTDPLHFHDMIMHSTAYYVEEAAAHTIWRMDLEIAMALVSDTLVCVFVALQIIHVKRYSKVPSSISLFMILILSVGHGLPLILNMEDVHLRRHRGNSGRLEANEVAVRLSSLVALLLQLRLLQLVWAAKQRDANGSSMWIGERKPGCMLLSLYVVGGLLGVVLNGRSSEYFPQARNKYSVWGGLRSYGGVILDGFLVPQVVLNALRGCAEKALIWPFYVGISAVRVAAHTYDLYRAHNYPAFDLKETYYYANPDVGFYSRAWDVVVPFGIIALVVVVFLQQQQQQRCGCSLAF